MKEQIRKQLLQLTSQQGLDEIFVDKIMNTMEKPITKDSGQPVAENETVVSTVSVMEKGILTVASQIFDTAISLVGRRGFDEFCTDKELILKIRSLKNELSLLTACFWNTVRTRLKEEGVASANDILEIRRDFQIVALPPKEMDSSSIIAELFRTFGNDVVIVQMSSADRGNVPSEASAECPCPQCEAKRAYRKESPE